ncbi:14494_t:CDS:2 [Ambispora leptoticha]|uniref:14494_t:CDS:1 n=1 Tax=Ambispora leptoticha TaxID=144679 RepID=A0A9N9FZ80_9GLOM|nr:14494_t:CDS:2 [Ambispora leptoticha]
MSCKEPYIVPQQTRTVNSNSFTEFDTTTIEHTNVLACIVCTEEKEKNLFDEPATQHCNHASIICKTCVTTHLRTQFESYGNVGIKCPNANCVSMFQKSDIKRFFSEDLFKRYELISTKIEFAKNKDFHYCLHLRCNSGQIHIDTETPIMRCDKCSGRTCLKHAFPLKPDEDCRLCELDRTKIFSQYGLKLFKKIFSKKPKMMEMPEEQEKRKELARLKHLKKANAKTKSAPGCSYSFKW